METKKTASKDSNPSGSEKQEETKKPDLPLKPPAGDLELGTRSCGRDSPYMGKIGNVQPPPTRFGLQGFICYIRYKLLVHLIKSDLRASRNCMRTYTNVIDMKDADCLSSSCD